MSTKDYQSMLEEVKSKVVNSELKYENTIIIGDNSSGKSEVLKNILEEDRDNYYFIDSVNRTFDYTQISKLKDLDKLQNSYRCVVSNRISNHIFNLEDKFVLDSNRTEKIEYLYKNFERKVESLVSEFFEVKFSIDIEIDSILGEVKLLNLGNGVDKLSSGYQAIIRIFLELSYFENCLRDDKIGIVIIDEVNEFLSAKNEEKIIPYLVEKFPKFRFVITTHSADVISSSKDFNIVVLSDGNIEYLDGNDYETVTDVRAIFDNIYSLSKDKESDIESELRSLLNLKISESWTVLEENKLKNLEQKKLSNSQKLMINQIRNW